MRRPPPPPRRHEPEEERLRHHQRARRGQRGKRRGWARARRSRFRPRFRPRFRARFRARPRFRRFPVPPGAAARYRRAPAARPLDLPRLLRAGSGGAAGLRYRPGAAVARLPAPSAAPRRLPPLRPAPPAAEPGPGHLPRSLGAPEGRGLPGAFAHLVQQALPRSPPPPRPASPGPRPGGGTEGLSARLGLAGSVLGIGDDDGAGSGMIAIDNKIEQAMDLVKSHLLLAVREEVELLREQIKELSERQAVLERENGLLRALATPQQLARLRPPCRGPPRLTLACCPPPPPQGGGDGRDWRWSGAGGGGGALLWVLLWGALGFSGVEQGFFGGGGGGTAPAPLPARRSSAALSF
ncbi:TSC22 domain family protein 4-like [Anser cygnoides]|uniref:TSC22 domain family protein 4-like n=1 Tax=Anser cygnoides TaxID=8845 RepID=UPI0034D219FB